MKNLFYAVGALLLSASSSFAALTLPTAMAVTDVEELAGLVIAGLAIMWGIRKVIKTVNRS